jgi:peptidyl-prolyl cis-trans isomerase A (cyclophilin A)
MKSVPALFAVLMLTNVTAVAFECEPEEVIADNMFPTVKFETSMGEVVVELNRMRAPVTANNFLRYALAGHYDGTIFHRVMADFVVQGGGYDAEFNEIPLHEPIMNESGNGLKNNAWTIALARFENPHSATSQFYFNMSNNEGLDPSARNWGYAVFGDVVSGRDVLEKIAAVETGYNQQVDFQDVPQIPVTLLKVTVE